MVKLGRFLFCLDDVLYVRGPEDPLIVFRTGLELCPPKLQAGDWEAFVREALRFMRSPPVFADTSDAPPVVANEPPTP